jgi:hypothetical protein
MRRYRNDAGTPTRTDFGVGLVAGLQAFPETAALAPAFEKLNENLGNAHAARRAGRKQLVKARVALRFAKYEIAQTIRAIHGAAEIADGGRPGPVTEDLFPGGLAAAIAQRGADQIAPAEELLGRFTRTKLHSVISVAERSCPKLRAGIARLKAAAAAHNVTDQNYVRAFKAEISLRSEHARQIDRLMGLVRAAFPFNKAKQDIIFPELRDEPRDAQAPFAAATSCSDRELSATALVANRSGMLSSTGGSST